MLTAHIKSPFGNRDEEWEDARVAKEQKQFVEETDVYVLGYANEQQEETFGVVAKSYWQIQEEVASFSRDLDTPYPGLVKFTKKTLGDFGTYFKRYKEMEDPLLARTSMSNEQYTEMEKSLKEIRDKNTELYVQLLPVMAIITKREQKDEAKLVLRAMLQALTDFSNLFYESTLSMSILLKGLLIRGGGGEYSPLDYVKDLNDIQTAATARREQEAKLTKARNQFLKYFP